MTERLRDVETRVHTIRQLSSVITAMRGVAAARSREARQQLDGIRTYAATVATGIGHALAFLPAAERIDIRHSAGGTHILVALCAEQGFAGPFSEHVLDAVNSIRQGMPKQKNELFIVGDRGVAEADRRGWPFEWCVPMVVHADQAAKLANRIVDALYAKFGKERIACVTLLFTTPGLSGPPHTVEKTIIPFDFSRFPLPPSARRPLITMPPQALLTQLAEEYVFAELCEAVLMSFAAENEARMRAMIAAKANVESTLDDLIGRSRQLRQEEITNEIVELAAGVML